MLLDFGMPWAQTAAGSCFVTRREPVRTRTRFAIPADHFWCGRCEAWLSPAFFERVHPRKSKKHPHAPPETLVGVFGLGAIYAPNAPGRTNGWLDA